MKVIGLLSTKEEVEELKYIAHVCQLEDRIRFITKINKVKQALRGN